MKNSNWFARGMLFVGSLIFVRWADRRAIFRVPFSVLVLAGLLLILGMIFWKLAS